MIERAAVAHHFEDAQQQHESNVLGMWAFLASEVLFFGGLFTAYAIYRLLHPEAFVEGSRHLDLSLGSINTAMLLASSLCMALSVNAVRLGRRRSFVVFLLATAVLGTAFLGIKGLEYLHKYQEGLLPGMVPRQQMAVRAGVALFLNLYVVMTGLHAAHLGIGVGLVLALALLAWRGHFDEHNYTVVELTGLYWHFVDVVWIFLFPLLYLLGRAS